MNQVTNNKEITIEHNYLLEASSEEVFNYLSNPLNDYLWQSSCDDVTMKDANEPLGAGVEYTIHFGFLSRKLHFQAHITTFEPNKAYGYEALSGPMPYRGHYEFTEAPEGVQVKWFFTAIPGKFFGIIPKSLIKKTMLKKTTEDIARLQDMFRQSKDDVRQVS